MRGTNGEGEEKKKEMKIASGEQGEEEKKSTGI